MNKVVTTCASIYIYMYMWKWMHKNVHVCLYTCAIPTYIHTYIHAYVRTYMTCIHTDRRTYIRACMQRGRQTGRETDKRHALHSIALHHVTVAALRCITLRSFTSHYIEIQCTILQHKATQPSTSPHHQHGLHNTT